MAKSGGSLGWWFLLVGAVMLLDPQCTGGCRTVGEHLFTHGLKRL
ncbi:MAG: hypothetical protein ACE5JN_16510 [Candidatus Methylomirabilia bacterium]